MRAKLLHRVAVGHAADDFGHLLDVQVIGIPPGEDHRPHDAKVYRSAGLLVHERVGVVVGRYEGFVRVAVL